VGGWIILKLILERHIGVAWTGLIGLGLGPVAGSCEHGNETSVSVKYWEVLE
jgi:hypothetical protein